MIYAIILVTFSLMLIADIAEHHYSHSEKENKNEQHRDS